MNRDYVSQKEEKIEEKWMSIQKKWMSIQKINKQKDQKKANKKKIRNKII